MSRNPAAIVDRLREEAEYMNRRGAKSFSTLLRSVARDIAEDRIRWLTEPITFQDAADESGYSYSSIQRLVAEGEILNVGVPNRPRVRRCDLPTQPRSRMRVLEAFQERLDGEPP